MAGPWTKISKKSIGKAMVILPAIGKLTGINSAKTDMVRKKISTSHILDNESKEGIKYIKRAIADTITTPM
jgi:hypothetical protein